MRINDRVVRDSAVSRVDLDRSRRARARGILIECLNLAYCRTHPASDDTKIRIESNERVSRNIDTRGCGQEVSFNQNSFDVKILNCTSLNDKIRDLVNRLDQPINRCELRNRYRRLSVFVSRYAFE